MKKIVIYENSNSGKKKIDWRQENSNVADTANKWAFPVFVEFHCLCKDLESKAKH